MEENIKILLSDISFIKKNSTVEESQIYKRLHFKYVYNKHIQNKLISKDWKCNKDENVLNG